MKTTSKFSTKIASIFVAFLTISLIATPFVLSDDPAPAPAADPVVDQTVNEYKAAFKTDAKTSVAKVACEKLFPCKCDTSGTISLMWFIIVTAILFLAIVGLLVYFIFLN